MGSTRRSYDLVAERYASEVGDELAGKPLDRALLRAFAELVDGPVLDLGCGPGQVGQYLAASGVQVFGSDLSPAMCRLARDRSGLPSVAGDLTRIPIQSGAAAGLLCMYAVIHLDEQQRASAYREFARVLRPSGPALVAFHVSDADTPAGGERVQTSWLGQAVELTFRFLAPEREQQLLAEAGLELTARLDRVAAGAEHPSNRCYLLVHRPS